VKQLDKHEFATLAMAIRTYYPKENILPNKEAMQLWYRELHDIPYHVAEAALRKWVSTNKWSPSIAEIREMTATVQHGEIPDWGEGWEEVQRAIRKHGMYNVKDAMDSFTPLTRQTVERLGFRNICVSENPMAERANFRQCYEILAKREQTRQQVALPLQDAIKQIQGGFMMIGDGGD
jgi:hypothetical protein